MLDHRVRQDADNSDRFSIIKSVASSFVLEYTTDLNSTEVMLS